MMLGYVHKTTKIYRIWYFSGQGRAIESSNVSFIENQNAWTNRSDDPQKGDSPFPADDTSDLIYNQEHDNDMTHKGQDPLPLSRDSYVTPMNGECQPLGKSMTEGNRMQSDCQMNHEVSPRSQRLTDDGALETVEVTIAKGRLLSPRAIYDHRNETTER